MVTLFIIALAIVSIIGIGLYFWARPPRDTGERVLPPPPDLRGLFVEDESSDGHRARQITAAKPDESALLARAQNGDRSVLDEAHQTGDVNLYDRVLNELVRRADSDQKLLALISYVGTNEFRVNTQLACAVIASWQKSLDRHSTSKALHFAALTDDANFYRDTVEQALQLWHEGKLSAVSALELKALFEGEFWILSSRSRSSGAGFVLKRTLDSARRELEAAAKTRA